MNIKNEIRSSQRNLSPRGFRLVLELVDAAIAFSVFRFVLPRNKDTKDAFLQAFFALQDYIEELEKGAKP